MWPDRRRKVKEISLSLNLDETLAHRHPGGEIYQAPAPALTVSDGHLAFSHDSMLSLLIGTQSFSAPSVSRRDVFLIGLGALGLAPTAPAFAEYMGQPPPKARGAEYKEALDASKEYKYAARPVAGAESSAFKEAEAKRKAAQEALAAGKELKKESVDENLARLGLKPYGS